MLRECGHVKRHFRSCRQDIFAEIQMHVIFPTILVVVSPADANQENY